MRIGRKADSHNFFILKMNVIPNLIFLYIWKLNNVCIAMNCYYQNRISNFVKTYQDEILGCLALHGGNDPAQMQAWEEEIYIMQRILREWVQDEAEIIFEYTIPRLNKRVDVVLLLRDIIFCIEFKVGQSKYLQQDVEQVMDYALDLKNFHKESHSHTIVPILVATQADSYSDVLQASVYHDQIYNPILSNRNSLAQTIRNVLLRESFSPSVEHLDINRWCISRYEPTPTIIEAASALYMNHSVESITRKEASGKSLKATTDYILNVIKQSHDRKEKSICFVTGVPGAGKTLVGLNVAIEQSKKIDAADSRESLAVYLSGNGPLVKVLTEALARDKKERDGGKITDARREVKRFIQEIYNYREQMLNKVKKPIKNGLLEIDEAVALAEDEAGFAEIEHIAIFDEAQRSWNRQKLADWLARGGSYGIKQKIAGFPLSEAEFLIWSLNLRKDWAVIVCLVGGGQEIHSGEAGIAEWINACNTMFPDWKVYISDHLTDKEYAEGNVSKILSRNPHVTYTPELHLSVSMRSFRAEKLSLFVHHLLERNREEAVAVYDEIKENYPIVLTRDIEKAKKWLRAKARGSERYGIVVSSKAERLRPLAIDVKRECDVVHWFLDDKHDLKSSLFLEDVATEFDVQGLELDWSCLAWDGDLRYTDSGWEYYRFGTNRWTRNKQEINQQYQLNAYRVLLTRARQGMVICVPTGCEIDETRLPAYYNGTYAYLKSLGLEEI